MISTMFKIRLKQFLRSLRKPLNLLGAILGILFVTFYGLGLGFILVYGNEQEFKDLPLEWVKNIVIAVAAFMTIARMFKPNYVPMRQTLMKYQPISAMQRYLYALVTDFQNAYFFFWIVFLVAALILSGSKAVVLSLSVVLVLPGGHFLRRTIQYFIDYRQNRNSGFYLLAALILAIISALLVGSNWFIVSLILLNVLLFLFGFFLDSNSAEKKLRSEKVRNQSMALKMMLNNKNVRTPLLVGFIMKALILGLDIFLFHSGSERIFSGQGFYWVFVSPAIIFTYIFNNMWGFWRSAWLNLEMRSGNINNMFRFIWQTIKYPVLLDILITFSLVFFVQSDYWFVISFYIITLIILVSTTFLWSTLFPKLIAQAVPKKGSTSYWSILYVFTSVLCLSYFSKGGFFYFLIPLFLLIALAGYIISRVFYPEKKYSIFTKLFRGE